MLQAGKPFIQAFPIVGKIMFCLTDGGIGEFTGMAHLKPRCTGISRRILNSRIMPKCDFLYYQ
jgi:hypothetical protein